MTPTARRFALLAAVLSTVLAACTNPTAPASTRQSNAPERPNTDTGFQGSVG